MTPKLTPAHPFASRPLLPQQCRTPLHLNEVSPRWGWCCDFTGMAAGVDYVFQLFDEDAYMGYSQARLSHRPAL